MNAPLPPLESPVVTLANGVRVVALPQPHLPSATVSVFVRTGSRHESPRLNGISHVVEHMAFKGTHTRSCQQVNLDAERLGAEVNAHTDKDHTAFHMRGMARHALPFVEMLGDIVQHSTFPEAELERERQVILQEFAEDEDDAFSTAFKLFDKMCFGAHPLAQPVIGSRRNIARFTRDELLGYVQRQYTGPNVVVAAAGAIDAGQVIEAAAAAFGALPPGERNADEPPAYHGGFAARRQPGVSQTHVVLGFPLPGTREAGHEVGIVAAALFGEGMSSPLMDEIRERRGLAYYVACSADLNDLAGQFVVEASMAPERAEEYTAEVVRLLREHADAVDPVGLERARNQIAVRRLEVQERPFRLLEEAAQDVFVHGQLRAPAERLAAVEAVQAGQVQACFRQMLRAAPAVGVAGDVRRATAERLKALLSEPRR